MGVPAFVGNGSFLSPGGVSFHANYVQGARDVHNITFDYIGVWNEGPWSRKYVVDLREALDSRGFGQTKIVVPDGHSASRSRCTDCPAGTSTNMVAAIKADPALRRAIGVLGVHSHLSDGLYPDFPMSAAAAVEELQVWNSEANMVDGPMPQWQASAAEKDGVGPGLGWPRLFIRNYLRSRCTATIICPILHSFSQNNGRHNHGPAQAASPWSGAAELGAPFVTQGHLTNFAMPGWSFVDSACGEHNCSAAGECTLSWVTLISPDKADATVLLVNTGHSAATLAVQLPPALQALRLVVSTESRWMSPAPPSPRTDQETVQARLPPRSVATLTTMPMPSAVQKQRLAEAFGRDRTPFPLPFRSDFAAQRPGEPGRFLSDLFGAFSVADVSADSDSAAPNTTTRVLRQEAVANPGPNSARGPDSLPFTAMPSGSNFANSECTLRARLPDKGTLRTGKGSFHGVQLCGRIGVWAVSGIKPPDYSLGVCLRLQADGGWTLSENSATSQRALANGHRQWAAGTWAVLGLRFQDDSVTALLDGEPVTTQAGLVAGAGVCGFGSGWHEAHFSDFELAALAGHARAPGSFLHDLLPPNRTTVQSFAGQWAGLVLDLRASLQVRAVGRLRAPDDRGLHRVNIVSAQSGRFLLPADTAVHMSNCTTDLLNMCYSDPVKELSLAVGRYYVVSWEDARGGGDRTLVMADSAAATTINHRDASTLTTYARSGIISGRVSSQPGDQASPKWTVVPQVDTSFGVLNLLTEAAAESSRLRTDDIATAFRRYEPGGWGAFLTMVRHPRNRSVWLAGSDVGGLFVTGDDSTTWNVCNADIGTKCVFHAIFLQDETPLLATTEGVYRGELSASAGPCIWRWTPSNSGLLAANRTETMLTSHVDFHHPVRVLHADSDGRVWAGIGLGKHRGPDELSSARQGDPYHVYVSHDNGMHWRGAVGFPGGAQILSIASGALGDGGAADSVVVTTALHGAWVTTTGDSWAQLGVAQPRTASGPAAVRATPCTSATCPARFAAPCVGASCLPINTAQNATSPNTGAVAIASSHIFLTIFEMGEADAGTSPCDNVRPDPQLKKYRGGPYRSADGGVRFEWLFKVYPFRGALGLRCPRVPITYSTPNFVNIAVDPADTTHLFLGGWGSLSGQGLHELRSGAWTYWNDCPTEDTHEGQWGCWEGRRPDSYQQDPNTYTLGFGVDWAADERRVITDGHVLSTPTSSVQHAPAHSPLVFFTTFRGGLRSAWDPVNMRRSFKHFNNDLVQMDAVPPRWRSTGLGDTCVWETAWVRSPIDGKRGGAASVAVLMAVRDGGIVRTLDDGRSFQRVSESWGGVPALSSGGSQGTAVVTDPRSGCVYAAQIAHDIHGHPCSVFKSCDRGDSWDVIGGFGNTSTTSGGLQAFCQMNHLAIDYSSPVEARRLLLGAGLMDGTSQVWAFRPRAAVPWTVLLNATGVLRFPAQGPHTLAEQPMLGLIALGSKLYVLDLKSRKLSALQLAGAIHPSTEITAIAPAVLSPGQIRVLIGGHSKDHPYGPALFSATIATASLRTTQVLDCSLEIDFAKRSNISAVQAMTVSSVVTDGQIVAAGLEVGAYYDGDVPPNVWISNAGEEFKPLDVMLPSALVYSMAFAPDGQLCLSTNGDGLTCVSIGTHASTSRLRTDDTVAPKPDSLTLFKPHDRDEDGVCLQGMRQIFGRNYSHGCPCWRIPSVVVAFNPQTRRDEVLVIAEGRWYIGDGCAPDAWDPAKTPPGLNHKVSGARRALFYRRSTSGGQEWGPVRHLVGNISDTGNAGNPTAVYLPKTKPEEEPTILVMYSCGGCGLPGLSCGGSATGRTLQIASQDFGRSWSSPQPVRITGAGDYAQVVPGPGNAVFVSRGTHAGRLFGTSKHLPCYAHR